VSTLSQEADNLRARVRTAQLQVQEVRESLEKSQAGADEDISEHEVREKKAEEDMMRQIEEHKAETEAASRAVLECTESAKKRVQEGGATLESLRKEHIELLSQKQASVVASVRARDEELDALSEAVEVID
jgi:translation initiation factor 2B subunit (eIF-2B alpha/beta/delta family)